MVVIVVAARNASQQHDRSRDVAHDSHNCICCMINTRGVQMVATVDKIMNSSFNVSVCSLMVFLPRFIFRFPP